MTLYIQFSLLSKFSVIIHTSHNHLTVLAIFGTFYNVLIINDYLLQYCFELHVFIMSAFWQEVDIRYATFTTRIICSPWSIVSGQIFFFFNKLRFSVAWGGSSVWLTCYILLMLRSLVCFFFSFFFCSQSFQLCFNRVQSCH